jgi:hypothetical protein
MSTYAVFGMTRLRAVEMARKKVPTTKRNSQGVYEGLSEKEWEVDVQAEADRIMAGSQTTQLSDKYDHPAPAFEYLKHAQAVGRGLHVKAWTRDGSNPKTGRPTFHWAEVRDNPESSARRE